jgi:short-subunit dehydrogenase
VAGIRKATAMELARRGMAVTIACRNKEKGEEAAAEIVRNTNNPSIRVMICDLASLTSVRQFAKEYLDQGLPLNSLVSALLSHHYCCFLLLSYFPHKFLWYLALHH